MTKQFDLRRAVKIAFAFAWAIPWTALGFALCLTVIGALVGVPLILVGAAPLAYMLRVTPADAMRSRRLSDEAYWAMDEEIPPWVLLYEEDHNGQ